MSDLTSFEHLCVCDARCAVVTRRRARSGQKRSVAPIKSACALPSLIPPARNVAAEQSGASTAVPSGSGAYTPREAPPGRVKVT